MLGRLHPFCGMVVAGCAVLAAIGCTPALTQAEIKFLETRDLDLPYDEAYEAAANGLFALGFSIDHSDKESGILSSKLEKKAAKLSVTFLLILPMPTISEGENDEAITFMLKKIADRSTRLRMKIVRNGEAIVDRELMTKIWQQIEREAMLETRPTVAPPGAPATAASGRSG